MATKAEKEQEMFTMIESWQRSGENQQAFCKAQGIAYSSFHYWYKKYRQIHIGSSNLSGFAPIKVHQERSDSPVAELSFPDGRRLTFYHGVDASFLRTLVD